MLPRGRVAGTALRLQQRWRKRLVALLRRRVLLMNSYLIVVLRATSVKVLPLHVALPVPLRHIFCRSELVLVLLQQVLRMEYLHLFEINASVFEVEGGAAGWMSVARGVLDRLTLSRYSTLLVYPTSYVLFFECRGVRFSYQLSLPLPGLRILRRDVFGIWQTLEKVLSGIHYPRVLNLVRIGRSTKVVRPGLWRMTRSNLVCEVLALGYALGHWRLRLQVPSLCLLDEDVLCLLGLDQRTWSLMHLVSIQIPSNRCL